MIKIDMVKAFGHKDSMGNVTNFSIMGSVEGNDIKTIQEEVALVKKSLNDFNKVSMKEVIA